MFIELLRKCKRLRGRRPNRAGQSARQRWVLQLLEDRTVPTIGFVVGSGLGNSGNGFNQVNVYDTAGNLLNHFDAFPGFNVGARVAWGDLTGDGVADVVVGVGSGGGPQVNVYDGAALEAGLPADQHILKSFFVNNYNTVLPDGTVIVFTGGVNVAVGDIDGQVDPIFGAQNEIVTGAASFGGPRVIVFDFSTLAEQADFFAYDFPGYSGGVSVACGNVGGDQGNPSHPDHFCDEIVTGTGPGGGPHVKIFSVGVDVLYPPIFTPMDQVGQFYAYDPSFLGGVNVSCGFLTNNRDSQNFLYADIITGAGAPKSPDVEIFRLDTGDNTDDSLFHFFNCAAFAPYPAFVTFGMQVAVTPDLNGDGLPDFITAPSPSGGGPHIKVWAGMSLSDLQVYTPPPLVLSGTGVSAFMAFDPLYQGGVYSQ